MGDCICPMKEPPKPPVFPLEDFLVRFPEFNDEEKHTKAVVQNAGQRAMFHITPSAPGMPMIGPYREYGLFLMTAHLLTLDDEDDSDDGGIVGTPFKATVGSVSVEATKPNSFQSDDWNYWLNQTKYGRELLAYLDTMSQGLFLNTCEDTVRDLL